MTPTAAAFDSVDEIQRWLLETLLSDGELVNPRGMVTRERIGVSFTLRDPHSRVITNEARRFSLPLAIGEFAWHMRAADDVATLAYYAKRWADFSEDSKRITGSCYGSRIFKSEGRLSSQWNRVVDVLREDPSSRRAVLSLWDDSAVLGSTNRDVPCTGAIQFLVRGGRLHAVVTMRSNDTIWGVPYDVFLFTMMQEYLAGILGVEVGEYTHFAASMHLYERHFKLAERILESESTSERMPPMLPHDELPSFLAVEESVRHGSTSLPVFLSVYWQELVEVLVWFRAARDSVSAGLTANQLPANRYRARLWLLARTAREINPGVRLAS